MFALIALINLSRVLSSLVFPLFWVRDIWKRHVTFFFVLLVFLWWCWCILGQAFVWRVFFLTEFSIVYTFIHMCIHWLGHLSPLPPLSSLPGRTCSSLLSSNFVENIRNNKKEIAFWLAYEKDSYSERFLALLPCTCVPQSELVHVYQTSPLLASHLPIVASTRLRLFYLLLYSGHIKHFKVLGFLLGFLPFPYSYCTCSPP
jgi:hypothetical protein